MDFTDKRYFEIEKISKKISDKERKRKPPIEINYELPKLSNINLPTIKEFYKNQNVFITGGNGFMGKVLVEKLLRSCPDLNKIYLLLRQKKGVSPEKRLNDMLENPVFDRLKAENPEGVSKLAVIQGDCAEPNLGMTSDDIQILKDNVNIVFHVAASVRFDDPLKKAVFMNVRSARDLISMAKEMKCLKVFVHVSTAYCNIDKQIIEEKVYPQQANWKEMIQMAEKFDDTKIQLLTAKILNGFPNTYTFTKSLAENIVNDECGNIPTVIYRPSIVVSTETEPFPGWFDNLNGPMGFYLGLGTGFLHVIHNDVDVASDCIPVDKAIINMIVASWYQANNSHNNIQKNLVINACTSNTYYLTYGHMNFCAEQLIQLYPFKQKLWHPFHYQIKSQTLFQIFFLIFQILPSIFAQIIMFLAGQNFPVMKTCRRAYFVNMALKTFTTNEWTFPNGNYLSLCNVLTDADRKDFRADSRETNCIAVAANQLYGIKKYMLKENPDDKALLLEARALQKKFHLAHRIVIFLFWVLVFVLIYKLLPNLKAVTFLINILIGPNKTDRK